MKKPQIFINSITSRFYTSTKYSVRVFYLFIAICIFFLASCENPFMEEILGLKTITFDTNGGGYIPEQKLLRGEKIFKPADPAKNGYDFCGWFEDNGTFHNKWNFNTAPEKTMTLYAKWEAEPDNTIIYTLILDTTGLTNDWDSASFSESGAVLETTALHGDIVTVYYNLEEAEQHNRFSLSVNGDRVFETETPETGTFNYTVNHSDADNGVITIHAGSIHSSLNLLYEPDNIHFNKTGMITFIPDDRNPSGTTYWYTLFRYELEVGGFTNMQITSGTTPEGIVNIMLENSGEYHVKVWAQTSDESYEPVSGSFESNTLHVHQVNLTISGITDGESITYETTSYSSNETFSFRVFGGDTVTLTAIPGAGRKVTWSGAGTDNTYTVIVTETTIITAEFADKLIVTVSANGGAAVNYDNLDAAFVFIDETAVGNFTVTLYEDQTMTVGHWINISYQNITIVGSGSIRTITHGAINLGTVMFTIDRNNASLTLGDNVTIKGRTAAGAGAIVNMSNGTFTMQGNSRIHGHNVNSTSGVVLMTGGTFNMKDDSVITGVTASTETSAAVYLNNANATFNMQGGQITVNNNSLGVNNTAGNGGVTVANGTFNMSGGSITNNTQSGEAADVYIGSTGNLTVSGNAEIGVLKLNAASATAGAIVTIGAGGWTGEITTLNLRGDNTGIAMVSGFWINTRTIFNNIDADGVARIGFGQFITTTTTRQAISPAYIIGKEGTDLGKLVLNPATAPVAVNNGTVYRGYTDLTAAFTAIGATPGNYTVTLRANQTLGAQSLSANQLITFVSSDSSTAGERTIQYNGANNSQMFSINNNGASLTLGNNITIKGIDDSTTDILRVQNGTLTMLNGSKITGHYTENHDVILVNGENANFIMSGGSITENASSRSVGSAYSGGIYLGNGDVKITGGSIIGNMPADIAFAPNAAAAFSLSGNAEIGVIMLDNSLSDPVISLPGTFTGNVAALHIRRNSTNTVNDVISSWAGKQIIQAASGYTLTPADIAKFTLGNFYTSTGSFQAIGFSNYINESGVLVGKTVYSLGGTGPAGGIIVYVAPGGFTVQGYGNVGDEGYFAPYTAYYLEAAPENASASTMRWSNTNVLIPNLSQDASDTTDRAIGRGRLNTAIIIEAHSADTTANNAAKAAAAYSGGDKNDWFLPSREELYELYIQRSHVVGITTAVYVWSSSQYDSDNARYQHFGTGGQNIIVKGSSNDVRAIRAF